MAEVSGLVLALGLTIAAYDQPKEPVREEYISAARTAFEGGYRQSGLKAKVDKELGKLEKKYVPKVISKYGSFTAIVIKTLNDKQLTLTWTF